jgi:hypothetical protein
VNLQILLGEPIYGRITGLLRKGTAEGEDEDEGEEEGEEEE